MLKYTINAYLILIFFSLHYLSPFRFDQMLVISRLSFIIIYPWNFYTRDNKYISSKFVQIFHACFNHPPLTASSISSPPPNHRFHAAFKLITPLSFPGVSRCDSCRLVSVAGSLIYRLRGIDPDGDSLTFGVRDQPGSDVIRVENFSPTEANIYLNKLLDREVIRPRDGLFHTNPFIPWIFSPSSNR